MSAKLGFRNIKTGTTLAISAVVTLAAVIFMAVTYYNHIEMTKRFQQRNAELNQLTTLINTVRGSVQWVYSYENDLVLERQKEHVEDGAYLYWERINLFNRRRHMEAATEALSQMDDYLRNPADREIVADLRSSIDQRFEALKEAEARNQANSEIVQQALDSGDESRLLEVDTRLHSSMSNALSILYAVDVRLKNLEELRAQYQQADRIESLAATQANAQRFYLSLGLVCAAILLNLILFNVGILRPVRRLMATIEKVREGDDNARTGLRGRNELGQLGAVLDELLDEKNRTFEEKEAERNALNASVISLIQNVFQLSQKDLTVRVPVAEDVTGAVSDSINQLAESIDTTLNEVIGVSRRVNDASSQIHSQSEKVLSHTVQEQREIVQTLSELDSVIKAMQVIAQLATSSHATSKQAITTSENAMASVSETIESINKIRETIHEAEKRIKRLGERSQEIGGIVSLINNISERTHVLSLNASMHAASAGEAGRGLTVVVDEVQRLAENSREATAEIETLVNNIQLETNDTIEVMNTVISEVVHGTSLAQEAGERMDSTRNATNSLVESVVRIAKSAVSQSKVARQLHERATSIGESTSVTNEEMRLQSQLSDQLVDAAQHLQQSVSVFKLTAIEPPAEIAAPAEQDITARVSDDADSDDDQYGGSSTADSMSDDAATTDVSEIQDELDSDLTEDENKVDDSDEQPMARKEHATG